MSQEEWRKCSVCKKSILLSSLYQKCSVSTCRKNAYCSVDCWDIHVPILNHKSAWAEEERAPKVRDSNELAQPKRILVNNSSGKSFSNSSQHIEKEILVVVSKLKSYVKAKGDLNTAADVSEILSDIIRYHTDLAIEKAKEDGRKTLMAKDYSNSKY